jgi:hypothetical protein
MTALIQLCLGETFDGVALHYDLRWGQVTRPLVLAERVMVAGLEGAPRG